MDYDEKKQNGEHFTKLHKNDEMTEGAKLDNLISSLGQFGRYQAWMSLMVSIASFLPAMSVVAATFLAHEPPHRCQVLPCENSLEDAKYDSPFLNFTTYFDYKKERWQECKQIKYLSDAGCNPDNFVYNTSLLECQNGYVFDDSIAESTVITDFDLWCVEPFYRSMASSAYMLGMLMGAPTIGALSDKIGRRDSLVVSGLFICISGVMSALAPYYIIFLVGRFLTGIGAVGACQLSFLLAVEFIGSKHRTFVGVMIQTPFALGEASTGVLAYFIRDWRYLQLAVTLPAVVLIAYRWYVPESIRWLVSQNRGEEAVKVLKDISKTNNKPLDVNLDFILNREQPLDDQSSQKENQSVFDLLKYPNMRKRLFVNFFLWAIVTFMYYGLSFNSGNIGNNIFISFILTMLIEIPSYCFSWWTLDCMGRKGVLITMYLTSGISCILSALLDPSMSTAITCLSLVGKFGAASGFAIVYIYAAEMFPTEYRGVAIGTCSMFARVGGFFAPIIVMLTKDFPAVGTFSFGMLGCLCALLILQLPETAGTRLPQTLAESEAFGSDQGMLNCCLCLKREKDEDSELCKA